MASLLASTITTHPFLTRTRPPTRANKLVRTDRTRSAQKVQELLYDDGYANVVGVGDYLDAAADLMRTDRGPPRWLCHVDCGPPLEGSPVLLFLPGIDGVGMGLFMHHKALRRIFEVRCMHVPFMDCTPFSGLVKFVEDEVRLEHSTYQTRPVYLLGHSFGGCLALSVAARNPHIDLIVILSNPETGLESIRTEQNPWQIADKLSRNLFSPLLQFSNFVENVSNAAIVRKMKLLKSASYYSNSRLHAVKAEVLILWPGQLITE